MMAKSTKMSKKRLKPSSAIDLDDGQKENIREWLKQTQN